MERLDPELLLLMDCISSVELFNKKQIRLNTSLLYKQQRYNLMREETEGYANIITDLEAFVLNATSESAALLKNKISSAIGYFDLDPSRVLAIMIDVAAFHIDMRGNLHTYFVTIVKEFPLPSSIVSQVIGFRLQRFCDAPIYENLCVFSALLIREQVIPLCSLLPHMELTDSTQVVALQSHFIRALLRVGLLDIALSLYHSLGDAHRPTLFPIHYYIHAALSQTDTWSLSPFLQQQRIYFTKDDIIKWNPSWQPSLSKAVSLLQYAKHHLIHDIPLLIKFLRLGKQQQERGDAFWLAFLVQFVLPCIASASPNPSLLDEIWSLLAKYPHPIRYAVYTLWTEQFNSASLEEAKNSSVAEAKRLLRRLSKENVKQLGRSIAKQCHTNPIFVFQIILEQIQAYENLILPVVDCLKYVTPLGLDVLSFCIIQTLTDTDKARLKTDGTNLSHWLQNLSSFCGHLYRKYYQSMDLNSIIETITCQLKKYGNSLDLIILGELLHKMGGIESVEELSEAQLDAQAAGLYLRLEVMGSAAMKAQRKSSQKLFQALVEGERLVLPLWILLGQQRSNTIFQSPPEISAHLKLLSTLTDKCHAIFLQFSEFIAVNMEGSSDSIAGQSSASMMATDLVAEYYLEPAVAYSIARIIQPRAIESLSNSFYELFWQLTLADVYVPTSLYTAEIEKLTLFSKATPAEAGLDPLFLAKKKKEKEKAAVLIDQLEQELQCRVQHCGQVQQTLHASKSGWLTHCK